jgi:hypothetical protein
MESLLRLTNREVPLRMRILPVTALLGKLKAVGLTDSTTYHLHSVPHSLWQEEGFYKLDQVSIDSSIYLFMAVLGFELKALRLLGNGPHAIF